MNQATFILAIGHPKINAILRAADFGTCGIYKKEVLVVTYNEGIDITPNRLQRTADALRTAYETQGAEVADVRWVETG